MNRLITLFLRSLVCLLFSLSAEAMSSELPTLLVDDVRVNEGEIVTLPLRLSTASTLPVRVTYSTRYGNAISGRDFASKSQRITFAPGVTEMSVSLTIKDDDIDEPDQFFWVNFRNPSGVVLPSKWSRVTIVDDDPEPTISFDKPIQSFAEGTGGSTPASVRVRLSHRSEKNIRFTVHTARNTATEFEFLPVAKRVLFDANGVIFNYVVNIVADADLEGRQQFFLFMRNPSNAELLINEVGADRIRTTVRILDDDVLVPPDSIQAASSFAWIGSFDRRFTSAELDAIASNSEFVVLAKFHASFDIELHNQEAMLLKSRNPNLRILPYFNAKHWFVESRWGAEPNGACLLKDTDGYVYRISTDRSDAHYFDLRNADCRAWILDIISTWLYTGLYDGLAFDSAGPIGDFGEGTFWQNLLGGQSEVDEWNAGLASLLHDAQALFNAQGYIVIFNGIGESNKRDVDRDTFQLAYTDGALNESFAVDVNGAVRASLLDDINLMQHADDKTLLMKTNLFDDGDQERSTQMGRFAYGCFLMGWVPGQSYFKFGVDDFYTTAELEDFPAARQLNIGLPVDSYSMIGEVLQREYANYVVFANPSSFDQSITYGVDSFTIPAMDAVFIEK